MCSRRRTASLMRGESVACGPLRRYAGAGSCRRTRQEAPMDRRSFCTSALAAVALPAALPARAAQAAAQRKRAITKGRLKQSVSRWCYGGIALDELCKAAAELGFHAIDLLDEKDWGVPAAHGLVCSLGNGAGPIHKGFNRLEHHDELVHGTERLLPLAKAAG